MNRIKEYYIAHFNGLERAFAWRSANAPHKFKPNSVGFLLVVQVAALGGVSRSQHSRPSRADWQSASAPNYAVK